jgi:hypothetical protein
MSVGGEEQPIKIADAGVYDYGTKLAVLLDNGPDLPHHDRRFPAKRLRVVRLSIEDLAPFIQRAVDQFNEKEPRSGGDAG